MEDAIEMANQAGILFVASAGNDGWSTDENPHFPSSYNHENIISVTATDNKDNQRYNWGLETVDMAGCSPRITTTRPGNTYDYGFSGTSAACPHVAGVAALVRGYDSSLTHMEVKTRLMDTVRHVPSLTGLCVTEGTVNAYNALSEGGTPPPLPEAPSGLTANAYVCDQINLEWTDNSDNENGFKIERSEDGVAFNQIDSVGPGVSTYSDTGLAENTPYWYQVRAYNTGGDSAHSNVATDTTPSCPPGPPIAPADLAAKVRGKSKIALTWKDNSNNENGFAIERRTDGTSFAEIDTIGANTISYVDTGVSPKTLYYYRVRAYNSNGNSNYSNTASARTK
jgi:subtilisin family serine protease